MAETTTVKIPSGPTPRRTWSAQPTDMLINCFVTCSPNNVSRGARSETRLFAKSSPSKAVAEAGTALVGETVDRVMDGKVVDAVGAIVNGVIVTGAGRGGSLAQWSFMTALSLDEFGNGRNGFKVNTTKENQVDSAAN
jgi:hypothetical protein